MSPALGESADTVSFFFDPGCPWTWITSRWFVDATARRGTEVRWRAFSLTHINEGGNVPEQFQEPMRHSHRALRVIESLTAEGRHADAGALYTELGTRTFVEGRAPGDDVLVEAAEAAGVTDAIERADDEANEALVRAAFEEIRPVVGEEVGSPTIRLDATGNALFGPVLNPAPSDADADKVLAATLTLLEVPTFFELKRSRSADPDFS